MQYKNEIDFLNNLYPSMHMEDDVMHKASKSDTPDEKIAKYLNRLEDIQMKAKENKHRLRILKHFYYRKYIIKTLPESYIKFQQRITEDTSINEIKLLKQIQKDQKKSLNVWLNYFLRKDNKYPIWFQYYAFRGMLQLNKYNKETGEFRKRSKTTTEKYIELNREALKMTYDTLNKIIGSKNEFNEDEVKALEHGISFKKLYSYYLKELTNYTKKKGIWIKYGQGSNYKALWKSLQGKNTGWSTAGIGFAKMHLNRGDFYVYYTKEENELNPRLAISMIGKKEIYEVCGIGYLQSVESDLIDVVADKLKEFPNNNDYMKKVHDMKELTKIEKNVNENKELSLKELEFLYEINKKIEYFGYQKSPRIEAIKQKRNQRKDLARIFHCKEENIGLTIEDFDKNNIIVFYGSLKLDRETVPTSFRNLRCICGFANFDRLISAIGLENLQIVLGSISIDQLSTTEGLENLRFVSQNVYARKLKKSGNLSNLQIGKQISTKELVKKLKI